MKALLCETKGSPTANFKVAETERPVPAGDEVLIRVKAAGLNPVDYKMAQIGFFVAKWPVVLGCDVAGVVEEVGPAASRLKKGDEVYAFTPVGQGRTGAFAEFCVCPEIGVHKKPPALSFEQAAALPVAILTATYGIFEMLQVPYPPAGGAAPRGEPFLIWGASGAVGSAAVQLAKLAGFRVVAVASARNAARLKALGADAVIDRSDPHVDAKIKEAAGGPIKLAYDTISPETAATVARVLAAGGGGAMACCAGGPAEAPAGVTVKIVNQGGIYATPEGRAILARMWGLVGPVAAAGGLQPLPVRAVRGLDGVVGGLQLLLEGKAAGEKVVCSL